MARRTIRDFAAGGSQRNVRQSPRSYFFLSR
jgi:hypothetical protein